MIFENEKSALHEIFAVRQSVAILEVRMNSAKEALELQAREYERRLEHLNNNQSRMDKSNEKSLSREQFESYKKEQDILAQQIKKDLEVSVAQVRRELDQWRSLVDKFMNEHTGKERGLGLSWNIALAFFGLGIGIGGLLINLLR